MHPQMTTTRLLDLDNQSPRGIAIPVFLISPRIHNQWNKVKPPTSHLLPREGNVVATRNPRTVSLVNYKRKVMWDMRHGCPLKVEEIIRNRDGTNVTSRLIFYFGFRAAVSLGKEGNLKFAEVKLIYCICGGVIDARGARGKISN